MNVLDVLKYGNQTLLDTLEGLPELDWETEGVCGWWSVKGIVAHLVSFEHLLMDVLNTLLGAGFGPYMTEFAQLGDEGFNDVQVQRRRDMTVAQMRAEYGEAHGHVMELAAQIPVEAYRENGTIAWYGPEYCLDDLIVYTNYAHKREHGAQIDVYRDRLQR